jgi:Caspase domain
MRFPRPGHTAGVILGAHAWPHFPSLNGGKSFCNSAAVIRGYLADRDGIGLADGDILDLFDSDLSADEQLLKIGEFLGSWIKRAGGRTTALTDLFLYYVGHGDFLGTSTEFLMLVQASRPRREMTAIQARALASVLRDEAPFVRQVVILDCCWSGAAHRIWQSGMAPDIAARGTAELMPNNGTVLLCSSSENMPSMAPLRAELTMFTGALIDALKVGSPLIQGDLSPRQVRDLAFDAMRKSWGADAVRPVVYAIERGSGDLSDVPLFPNRAKTPWTESDAIFEKVKVKAPEAPKPTVGPAVVASPIEASRSLTIPFFGTVTAQNLKTMPPEVQKSIQELEKLHSFDSHFWWILPCATLPSVMTFGVLTQIPTIILGLLAPIVIPIAAFGLLYAIVAFVSYWTALGRKKETELPVLPPLPPTAEAWERDRAVRLLRKSRTKTIFRGEFVSTLQLKLRMASVSAAMLSFIFLLGLVWNFS